MGSDSTDGVPPKRTRKRRQLSCLPCRQHKLKCDRKVPCESCVRYRRSRQCSQHPSPETRTWTRWTYTRLAQASMEPRDYHLEPSQGRSETESQGLVLDNMAQRRPGFSTERTLSNDVLSTNKSGANELISSFNLRKPIQAADEEPDFSTSPRPLYLSHPTISVMNTMSSQPSPDFFNTETFWKGYLMGLLPTQNQCDMLVAFYLENINWLYHAVHVPLFRRRYYQLWTMPSEDVDLIWLSLLFTMLSLSALYISPSVAEAAGFEPDTIRRLAHTWHGASRQALFSGGFESRPRLLQLATFLATQLYWLSTKNGETMNSCLGQAVRNAQALQLDRDRPASPLEVELRRRAWWELACCDTFQSLCFGRTPLISAGAMARVPLPANIDDIAVSDDAGALFTPRPDNEPTDMSAKVARAQGFQILHKLFADDGAYMTSWTYVAGIDAEVQAWQARLPWFFHPAAWQAEESARRTSSASQQTQSRQMNRPAQRPINIQWSHHVLHSSVCMQRIRLARPFLSTQHDARIRGEALAICLQAARSILDAYKHLREGRRTSPRFHVQSYQSYSSAVQLVAFLLVEHTFETEEPTIRQDIEMIIEDLGALVDSGAMAVDGRRVLKIMLQLCDMRRLGGAQTQAGPVPHEEELATEIGPVFGGGENTARRYLRRCDISYLLNQELSNMGMLDSGTGTDSDLGSLLDFDVPVDMLSVEQWDLLFQDTNFATSSF